MNSTIFLAIFYLAGAVITFIFTYFISQDKLYYRILASSLVGLTWPLSLIPAFFFSML
ncbi:TPA: GhoT/OrtT family toxin [Yersinia enterocolitica]|nr:GhoT/OrtT family toxin [Yersinia enterocolitica]